MTEAVHVFLVKQGESATATPMHRIMLLQHFDSSYYQMHITQLTMSLKAKLNTLQLW